MKSHESIKTVKRLVNQYKSGKTIDPILVRKKGNKFQIFTQSRTTRIAHIAPGAIHPRHALEKRGDMRRDRSMQFCIGIGLPNHP